MGMGLMGAISGAGGGLQAQGQFWAEEKKQAAIAKMKESSLLAAEGRAEKSKLESEGRADARAIEAEKRASAEADRRAASQTARARAEADYTRGQEFEDAKKRKEEGLSYTSTSRPRSEFEASNAYETYKKNELDRGMTPDSFEDFVAKRTGRAPAASTNGEPSSAEPERGSLMGNYGDVSKETASRLKEFGVPSTTLTNMKRAIGGGKLTTEEAAAKLKDSGYPDEAITALMAELELSGL